MSSHTISTTIYTGITLTTGSSIYSTPLTVTTAGTIAPAGILSETGITIPAGNLAFSLALAGQVNGGAGPSGTLGQAGIAENDTMSAAGYGGSGGTGGNGGTGIYAASLGTIANTGSISGHAGAIGGTGGMGGSYQAPSEGLEIGLAGGTGGTGGQGGAGAALLSGGHITNTAGLIQGGAGGTGGTGGLPGFVSLIGESDPTGNGGTGGLGGTGVELSDGSVSNAGTIIGGAGGQGGRAGPEGNDPEPAGPGAYGKGGAGGTGLVLSTTGHLTNTGLIAGGAGGAVGNYGEFFGAPDGGPPPDPTGGAGGIGVELNGGTLLTSGTIAGGAGGTAANAGSIGASGDAVVFGALGGTIIAAAGAVFSGGVVGNGTSSELILTGSSTTAFTGLNGQFTGLSEVDFASGADRRIKFDRIGAVDSTLPIAGFAVGDRILIDDFVEDSANFSGTDLSLGNSLGVNVTLDMPGNFTTNSFIFTESAGNTTITLCHMRGTRVLTPSGEKCVEDLRAGDLLPTLFGGLREIKWIGEQRFNPRFAAGNPDIMPVKIAAGALGPNLPARDLHVSPGHAMLVGENLILARNLVNGITITRPQWVEEIHYFNIEFEAHDCIRAEGCWSESFADGPGLRNQFHNAAAFYARFPAYVEPDALMLCAPRPLEGPALAAALAPILARTPMVPGVVHGFVDAISADGRIAGWAQDTGNLEYPVALEIFASETRLGTALACIWRDDLAKAGLGSGDCAFEFRVPDGLTETMRQSIRVVPGASLVALPRTDFCKASLGLSASSARLRA